MHFEFSFDFCRYIVRLWSPLFLQFFSGPRQLALRMGKQVNLVESLRLKASFRCFYYQATGESSVKLFQQEQCHILKKKKTNFQAFSPEMFNLPELRHLFSHTYFIQLTDSRSAC